MHIIITHEDTALTAGNKLYDHFGNIDTLTIRSLSDEIIPAIVGFFESCHEGRSYMQELILGSTISLNHAQTIHAAITNWAPLFPMCYFQPNTPAAVKNLFSDIISQKNHELSVINHAQMELNQQRTQARLLASLPPLTYIDADINNHSSPPPTLRRTVAFIDLSADESPNSVELPEENAPLKKAKEFLSTSYNKSTPYMLSFSPETGSLQVQSTSHATIDTIKKNLKREGIHVKRAFNTLYIDTLTDIEKFFDQYFKGEQIKIDREKISSGQQLDPYTVLLKLLLVTIGISVYEFNKEKLSFNYRKMDILCPWINEKNEFCMELIDNSEDKTLRRVTIQGFDSLTQYIFQNNIHVPEKIIHLLQKNCYRSQDVFSLIEEAADKKSTTDIEKLDELELSVHNNCRCPIGSGLIRTPVRFNGTLYNERDIQNWLKSNTTDPKTRATVTSKHYTPDYETASMLSSFTKVFAKKRHFILNGEYRAFKKPAPELMPKHSREKTSSPSLDTTITTTSSTSAQTSTSDISFWPSAKRLKTDTEKPQSSSLTLTDKDKATLNEYDDFPGFNYASN